MKDEILAAKLLNGFAATCRVANDKWWRDPASSELIQRNHGELFMLMVGEIAEAMEGQRKNLMDPHLPHRKNTEVELADALIRIFDYCGEHYPDIGTAFMEKMAYNAVRADHTAAERLKPHGKRF
jgi:NTP pyrophosphatase (non-canonical NTP hydrolase)